MKHAILKNNGKESLAKPASQHPESEELCFIHNDGAIDLTSLIGLDNLRYIRIPGTTDRAYESIKGADRGFEIEMEDGICAVR